jgi:hypothetical protein
LGVIASFLIHLHEDGAVTCSSFDAKVASHDTAVAVVQRAMPGTEVIADPWADQAAPWPGGAQPSGPSPAQQPQGFAPAVPPAAPAGYGQGAPTGYQQPQASYQQPQHPNCAHGPLKPVPGGWSQSKNKSYPPFWGCQAPQGQQKCNVRTMTGLPDVRAFLPQPGQSEAPPF